MHKVPQNKNVSINFSDAAVSLSDFVTLKSGTDMLTQNVGK